jgi:MFS-type transporter involved in bile tolerance (Atg22 family)
MFLKLRYNAEITDVTNIALVFGLMMMINQLGLVPLLSGKFQFRDTSILIIGMSTSIIGCIILAIGDNLNIILLSCFFGSLYISINSTARSAMTKLVDPADIGSLFGMCGIIFVALSLVSKPFYSLVYRATVQTFPAAFLYLTLGLLVIVLVLIISAHVGMKKLEESIETEKKTYEQVEVAKVMSERLLY